MDWLLERQDTIQKEASIAPSVRMVAWCSMTCRELLRGHHLCAAKLGYNRDGKKGLLQVNYGLLTDARGAPVAVSVHEGNTPTVAPSCPRCTKLRGLRH